MVQGHGLDGEHRIFEHGEERAVGGQCGNGGLFGRLEAVTRSEHSLANLVFVELTHVDRERIAVHEIPGIAAQFAGTLSIKPGGPNSLSVLPRPSATRRTASNPMK